jgi:TolB protein
MLQTVAADGANLRQIATDIRGSRPHKPVHSPDGQEIVFVHAPSRDSAEQLWIMAADGTNPHVLVEDFDGNEPAWSPDGQQIAFASDPGPGNGDIYVVERDGTELRQLTSDERDDHTPVWSPDGQQIAVMAFAGVGPIQELHVMAADGSNVRKLATNPQPFDNNRPVWSPDGGQIAFLVSEPNDRTQVWAMNADGSNLRMLTDDPRLDDIHQDEWPGPPSIAWSPDGQWIAFSTIRDGNSEIYLMHPDGTGQRNLTNDPTRDDFGPVWSPESTQIAFVSRSANIPSDDFEALNRWSIHVMDADGSNQQTVADPSVGIVGNFGYEFQPPVSWRHEG